MIDPAAFDVHRMEVREGVELGYLQEGRGGVPLLLVHGWPETMRIWWRNVAPLADAGFEVIVPDLRGFGTSSLAPDEFYDLAAHSRDLEALLRGLGHTWCVASGGDLGGGIIQEMSLRFDGLVRRQLLFNCILPMLNEQYEAAGIPSGFPPEVRQAADYYIRHGREADAVAGELRSDGERERYVAQFYGPRFWATPGAFRRDDVAFMTAPFADPEKFRAGLGNYESAQGTRPLSETPRWFEVSDVPTLALHGPDDHVMPRDFPDRCEVAFGDLVGPFVVPRSGHFLQWERAELLNKTLIAWCADVL